MADYNGHVPAELIETQGDGVPLVDRVAGDTGEPAPELRIYVAGRFEGGPTDQAQIRDVTVSIPVLPGDTYREYAVAIEAAIREIGNLGYLPGHEGLQVQIAKGAAPSWV